MSSIKCPHCGLVNFASDETCKRCKKSLVSLPPASPPPEEKPVSPPSQPPPQATYNYKLCTTCGYVGWEKSIMPGSFWLELGLWAVMLMSCALHVYVGMIMLLFAVGYSIWRLAAKRKACPQCSAAPMIPVMSPVAQKFFADHQMNKGE